MKLASVLFFTSVLLGQQASDKVPIYHVTVVQHSIKAVNYRHRNLPTKVDFRGTVLDPQAKGEAVVQSKRGATEVEAKFEKVQPPSRYGAEYLTYVLWAITPDGRANNLGEIVLDDQQKGKLDVTTELQAFGLLVTAEPYRSVTQPSDVVVMENVVRPDTSGKVEQLEAKYELLPRGHYTMNAPSTPVQTEGGKKIPLDQYEAVVALYQARNAVQIARSQSADRYAADTFARAEQMLQQAERFHAQKSSSKQIITAAREATQTAEDARMIAIRKQGQQKEELERTMAAEREARARAEAEDADRARREVERAAQERSLAQAETEARPAAGDAFQDLRSEGARQSTRGLVIDLYDDVFQPEGPALLSSGQEKLARIARVVAANPALKVEVEGYGMIQRDQDLAGRRASMVRDYLIAEGIPAVSISARGLTMRPPADAPQSRHVEIVISGGPLTSSLAR